MQDFTIGDGNNYRSGGGEDQMIKIWEFLKKYWKHLLVIPIILLALATLFRWYVKLFVDSDKPDEDLHKADVKLRQDTEKTDRDEKIALDKLKETKDTLVNSIEAGDPSAANVMNEFVGIGKGKEGEKK
jgi:hypothetical protein